MDANDRKSIIITGIHGFVGHNLVKVLSGEFTIYGVDIRQNPMDGVMKIFRWDQLSELPHTDTIIHLAGIAHDMKNSVSAKQYFDVNTGLTIKIYDWFLKSTATRFIFFSSIKALVDRPGDYPLTEEVIPSPEGFYGKSKRAAEEYILNNLPRQVERLVYILRPAMIYGPGNKGNLNLLYRFVKTNMPWPLGAFTNQRSFCSIDNLICILLRLVSNPIPSGIYHIADDEYMSTNELVTYIAEGLNRKPCIVDLPVSIVKAAAWAGSVFYLPFNRERLKKLTENYMVSNSKIKMALNIQQLPVRAHKGIVQTIKSFAK